MIYDCEVYLWKSRIGYLHQDENSGIVSFEYDRDFQTSGIELSPFQMPLSNRVYTFPELRESSAFHGLAGLFADSLPDKFGNAVINQWLASQGRGVDSFTALERLCYTGSRGMGALEYVPAVSPAIAFNDIDVTEMVALASDVLSNRQGILKADEASKMQLLDIGSSVGGARAKAVIAWNEKTNEIKSGQIDAGKGFDYWLIKFDGVSGNGDHEVTDSRQHTLIEYAYYLMAKDLGIDMSECRIYEKDNLHHFMTKRFDRENGKKLHTQTLGALGHLDFNIPNCCSYETYAGYAKGLKVDEKQLEQIFRRMVFAVFGVNCDDHVKNFSFLMDRNGVWRISPAYDITFAYRQDNIWLSKHQMSINGKTSPFDITEDDIIKCGINMGLNASLCKGIIDKTIDTVLHWLEYAERCGITEERAAEIFKHIQKAIAGSGEHNLKKRSISKSSKTKKQEGPDNR